MDEFKDTEVGPIPLDWKVGLLKEAVDFSHKPRSLELSAFEYIPFVPMELIPDQETHINNFVLKRPDEIASGSYCNKGDLLLAKITPSFENGKQGILEDIPLDFAYATTEVYPISPKPDTLDRMFLFGFLKLPSVRSAVAQRMEGSTGRQRVPKPVIENLLIPLPPLVEQRRIAAVLNAIQEAIAAQDDVIAAARAFKRSLMQRLFTYGPGREPAPTKETNYGAVPAHWREFTLNDCAYVQTGTAKGRRFRSDEQVVEVPYLRVANVQDGFLDLAEIKEIAIRTDELARYSLQIGDVLMTEGGDFDKLGRGYIWQGEIPVCIHQNHVFAVRTDRNILSPQFLAYLVQSPYGKSYFLTVAHRTTNLASINTTKLKALPVQIPSKGEQQAIVDVMFAADAKIAAEEDRKTALEALFKSMLHQLMTGQIRLLSDEGLPLPA